MKPVHPVDARYQGACRLVVEPIPVASVAAGDGAGAVSDSPTTPAPAPNTWTCAQCGKESNAEAAAVSKSKPGVFCSAKCADAPSNATEPVDLITEVLFRYVEEFGSIASIFRIRDVSQGIADRLRKSTPPAVLTPPAGHLPDLLDLIDLIEDVLVKHRGMSHRGQAREVAKALESARLTRTAP